LNTPFPRFWQLGSWTRRTAAILRFFVTAQSFNLCLDLTQQAAFQADGAHNKQTAHERMMNQARRARLKADHMRPGSPDKPTEFDSALTAVRNGLPWEEVRRIQSAVEVMDRPRE
jgi:hypothetical protein